MANVQTSSNQKSIGIINYGMGNLHSVKNAFDYININCGMNIRAFISNSVNELSAANGLILPGVGAFPQAMDSLAEYGLVDFIKNAVKQQPLLGICLGMQLLFEKSHEFKECAGLGLFGGEVVQINAHMLDSRYKIPHMGWNSIKFARISPLYRGIGDGEYVYFVHSFKVRTSDICKITAYTHYGEEITAAVEHHNIFATQFHPEKSGAAGLTILKNFAELI